MTISNPMIDTKKTSWPESIPSEDEDHIVSIVCGNTHLHWSFHNGVDTDMAPALFWRTPPLKDLDTNIKDQSEMLSRHLPQFVHDYLFGRGKAPTINNAIEQQELAKRRPISVYVVSAVTDQSNLLNHLWQSVPCRFFLMKGDDFFTTEEGRYETMGVDRLAALRGTADLQGFPALVFDGGTAWTYTAADGDGNILGGGIGPGLHVKFAALKDYTDALPQINPTQVTERVKLAMLKQEKLQTFALDTRECMVGTILTEFVLHTKHIIKKWLDIVGDGTQSIEEVTEIKKQNSSRTVFVTGGDGEILTHVLKNESDSIIENLNSSDPLKNNVYSFHHQKHLIHYGISAALMKQIRIRRGNGKKQTNEVKSSKPINSKKFLGVRVAKKFDVADSDGEKIFRGSVVGVHKTKKNEEVFLIRYDDDDKEDVAFKELQAMITFFEEVGEKKKENEEKEKKLPNVSDQKEKVEGEAKTETSDKPKIKETKPLETPNNKSSKENEIVSNGKRKNNNPNNTSDSKKKKNSPSTPKLPKYINHRVSKWFDKDLYFGTVTEYDKKEELWKILYDDNDEEEFEEIELENAIKLYEERKDLDPKLKKKVKGRVSKKASIAGKSRKIGASKTKSVNI